jgi:polysaccharide pyruvyl transferase WcaK-like protein
MVKFNDSMFITNQAPEKDFMKCLAQSSHIITSSYHGAYWGLLSGRTVTLMGYSFKFKSLLNI